MHHRTVAALAVALTLVLAGCGGDDENGDVAGSTPTTAEAAEFGAVKDYLLAHTERLQAATQAIQDDAEAYYDLAESAGFDYAALLRDKRSEVAGLVGDLQEDFRAANPAYEEMEGVVAGVPSLADFDVIIDAGADKSDPENAVPFSVKTPAGRTFEQPGNYNFLVETAVFGTEPKFQAEDVEPDLDGNGKVAFGEALPDADFLVAVARDFKKTADELDTAARAYEPTRQDVLTALVVMTPTMSEYFEAWKNSRFVAGAAAEEKAFVAASRLQDIGDILGGLVLVYDNVEPVIAEVDGAGAAQTGRALDKLFAFTERLRKEEEAGRKFTAAEADTLGSEAQRQAEAVAGQVSQAAGQLGIELET